MNDSVWQFATAGNIRFGRGSLGSLSAECGRLQLKRPLIVTDSRLTSLPAIRHAVIELESIVDASVFDACVPEPSIAVAEAAVEAGRSHDADGIIGIGGGSNLDVAKIAAVVLKHGGKPGDYFGFDCVPGPILPLIAVPTTAGTGSEVSHSAVLSDPVAQVKVSTLSRWLRPAVAIIDPRLTDSCPPTVTAHSGIDALVHAVEAYTNRDYRDMIDVDPQARAYEGSYSLTRLIAAEAIRLIGRHLVNAYEHPAEETARDGMALAAMLAGMAFSNSGVAIVHALEYPIGALTHCSHGEGNGLLLPHVMRYNLPACTERLGEIAELINVGESGSSLQVKATAAIEWVVELQKKIGIRRRLEELGLKRETIPLMASKSFQIKRLMDINPRRPTEADLQSILEAAF